MNATVVELISYQAFGAPNFLNTASGYSVGGTPFTATPFAFANRAYDSESGLYYFVNRYLDPTTGRFVEPDPLGIVADATNLYSYVDSVGKGSGGLETQKGSLSTYQYAFNSPTNWTDPLGLAPDGTAGSPGTLQSCLATCSENVFGLANGVSTAASLLGAFPIGKGSAFFGSSPNTNLLRTCGTSLFGDAKLPFQLPILQTNSLWGALGRANVLLATGLFSYDVTSIALCTNACASGDVSSVYYP